MSRLRDQYENEYLDNIIASVDMQAIRNAGLKVAVDPMYGVSETSIKTILLTARCEVSTIHERHDTLFGGKLPAPSASTLHALQNFVVEKWNPGNVSHVFLLMKS